MTKVWMLAGRVNRRGFLGYAARSAAVVGAAWSGPGALLAATAGPTRSVTEFGAVGDGAALETKALQRCIDAVSLLGGGTVVVPAGRYVTGTLRLKSGVRLQLERGATLLGSLRSGDYEMVDGFIDAVNTQRGYALLAAMDAHDVALTGEGTIDGRGMELQAHDSSAAAKPFLVRWVRCSGVTVEGVTLQNAAAWTMHCFQCSDVRYQNVRIHSFGVENNDGLDIDSSERVTVDQCQVESQDDAICLKTTSVRPCKAVRVTNCTVRTHHGALKIGTESMGDIEDVVFDNNHVIDAREAAVKFCAEDGAHVRDVTVSNLVVDLADTPIFLRLGGRMRTYRPGDPKLGYSTMERITLRDIHVTDSTRTGILVTGFPGHPVRDVTLRNVYVKLKGELNTPEEGMLRLPENVKDYPEVWMFGPLIPAYGMYLRHVEGVVAEKITYKAELADARPALVLEDAAKTRISEVRLTGYARSEWLATVRECSGVSITDMEGPAAVQEAVRVAGASSAQIVLDGIRTPGQSALYKLEDGAKASAVTGH